VKLFLFVYKQLKLHLQSGKEP